MKCGEFIICRLLTICWFSFQNDGLYVNNIVNEHRRPSINGHFNTNGDFKPKPFNDSKERINSISEDVSNDEADMETITSVL